MADFFRLFQNHSFLVVAFGASILGMVTGGLGTFVFLRKQSLLGDGIAHCALPGVVLAFLLTGEKNLEILLLGGAMGGILGSLSIQTICKYSKIKFDSALAMTLSVFFGFGLMLLTHSQKLPNAQQAGLDSFIYGQAAAMLRRDVLLILMTALFLCIMLFFCWKPFKLLTFDPIFAQTLGYPVGKINLLLHCLLIFAIVVGLQTVGVILMSAMLVAPAITARPWVKNLSTMVFLSSFFGGFSAFIGTTISSLTPGMPTGAVIVVVATAMAFLSLALHHGKEKYRTSHSPLSANKKEEVLCHLPQKSKS